MGNTNCFKYRPADGKIWSVVFNHPLRLNPNGEKGRLTRRSLRTVNSKTADGFVNEMKDFLSQKDLWEGKDGKLRAEKKYNAVVTSAFYDSILPEEFKDNESTPIRENLLPLPSSDDGYSKVLLVGTTGAGKSTLLRQLIGTTSEKFPLITSGKATVSDLEVIVAKGDYKAVVTFITKPMTELYVQDCVYYAILKALKEGDKKKIFDEMSENKEQTFRLRHILGNFKDIKPNMKEPTFSDDDESGVSEKDKYPVYDVEKSNKINEYLEKIIKISYGLKLITLNKESDIEEESENESIDSEFLHKAIYENKDFTSLVNEIVEDIESRFSLVKKGILRIKDKWPQYWEFETANRKEFLDSLQIFSSNEYKDFGNLLTPLVQGVRVQGPFYSENSGEEYPKLVFFDGQGLGHTAESAKALSLPQSIENKFELADVILLVDNASQPMQYSSLLVLRSVVASGYTDRLKIAFTHFDLVKGDNFGSRKDRRMHVYCSLKHVLSNLKKDIGPMVERLETDLEDNHCFFLEGVEKSKSEIEVSTLKQLEKLLHDLQKKTKPNYIVDLKPQYDGERLCDEIYSSVKKFRMKWDIRFSGVARVYDTHFDSQDVKKEHWARIKALNRRIAEFGIIEYYNLMPVSELRDFIKVQISSYLEDSLIWGIMEPSNEDKYEFREAIKRNISKELGEYIKTQMIDEHMEYWIRANNYSGTGSAKLRATDIDSIYDQVSSLMKTSPNWREHVPKIKILVDNSIDSAYEETMSKSAEIPDEPSNFIEWNVS